MIKKKYLIATSIMLFIVVFICIFQGIETNKHAKTIEVLEQELIEEYNRGYLDRKIDDFYELAIENAVLKWRLENQETKLTVEELDDLIEWIIRYYEVEAQALRDVMLLDEYIKWKDPELYDKMLDEALKWECN